MNVDKYVDDNLQEEAVNMENAEILNVNGVTRKIKQAIPTQNVFRYVVRRAEEQGMRVNTAKTSMICICLLYTSPSPRDRQKSRMPSSA